MYKEYNEGFDIQDPDTRNTMMMMCKTTIKANEALDVGDMESFSKLSRSLDSMRKSVKFTAQQNKDKEGEAFDTVGLLVSYCEEHHGRIPRLDTSISRDVIDLELKDTKQYLDQLIKGDSTLATQIENYIKKEIKNLEEERGETGAEVTDSDFLDAADLEYEQMLHDEQIMMGEK